MDVISTLSFLFTNYDPVNVFALRFYNLSLIPPAYHFFQKYFLLSFLVSFRVLMVCFAMLIQEGW